MICIPRIKMNVTYTTKQSTPSPLFLVLVHTHSTWAQGHYKQQATDDREGLEEVILHEVSHDAVGGDHPEGVEQEVGDCEPGYKDEGGELGLVADTYTDDEYGSDEELHNAESRQLQAEEGEEHEDDEDTTSQLHVALLLIASQGGHTGKHGLSLGAGLSQQQHQPSCQGQVPGQRDRQ